MPRKHSKSFYLSGQGKSRKDLVHNPAASPGCQIDLQLSKEDWWGLVFVQWLAAIEAPFHNINVVKRLRYSKTQLNSTQLLPVEAIIFLKMINKFICVHILFIFWLYHNDEIGKSISVVMKTYITKLPVAYGFGTVMCVQSPKVTEQCEPLKIWLSLISTIQHTPSFASFLLIGLWY